MQRSLVHSWIGLHTDSNKLHCISPSKNRFTKRKRDKQAIFLSVYKWTLRCYVVGWDIIEKTLINISSVASLSSFLIIINLRRETDDDDDKPENDNDSIFFTACSPCLLLFFSWDKTKTGHLLYKSISNQQQQSDMRKMTRYKMVSHLSFAGPRLAWPGLIVWNVLCKRTFYCIIACLAEKQEEM